MSSPYPASNDHNAIYVNQMEPVSVAFPVTNRDPALANQKDYVLWSFFNTIFCNVFCLGFLALVYSIKARDRKVVNDMHGAAEYARTAKQCNIAVSVLFGVCVSVTIFLFIILAINVRPPR